MSLVNSLFYIYFISTIVIDSIVFGSNSSGHVLSSRSDPSVRDRLPKIEMNATSHSIVMTLHPATIPDANIKRYHLQYGINFPYQYSIFIPKNQTSIFIDKLEPNQKYIFSLIALNENNDTVITEQFYDFQMPSEDDDRQPPKTPLELNLIPKTKTSVLLQWTDVDYPKNVRIPSSRRYKVQINELDGNQRILKQDEFLTPNEQSFLIENLKSTSNYEFAVRTIDGDLESDYSMSIEYSNAVFPIKKFNMITNNDPSKVTLTWSLTDEINGIKSFHIYHNEQGEMETNEKLSIPADRTQTVVSNLKPNTKYRFKIVSANQFNDESTPEIRWYKTPEAIELNQIDLSKSFNQTIFGLTTLNLSNQTWLLIGICVCLILTCFLMMGIVFCLKCGCCSCLSNKKTKLNDSPSQMHQRQYSPTSNTASSLIKPTDLWAGADCLSSPPVPNGMRNSNVAERHYETSSNAGSGTLSRCNHHHHHHLYHHTQETQPLTTNIDMENDQHRHSYVPSNDGSSSFDGNTTGFNLNSKFNSSMRTRPIAVGAPFESQTQKKSMKNLPMGTAFIMNHNQQQQQTQHVTVRPIQQKAQYVVRPNEQPYSIGSGPSSPDYQHSPSNSHCSSNHNPPSLQSNPTTSNIVYEKVSNSNDNGNNPRALLVSSKPNLRSFTVPVAPPIIPPPPPMTTKQPIPIVTSTTQYKSPFRSPNRSMLNNLSKDLKSISNDETETNPADVLEDVRNQLGNLMKKDFQC